MKAWWRKWSYDIPLAFSDALWDVLVVQFAAFLDRLTLRKVLEFVAIAILAIAFAQTFPIDIAFLFAGDTLMYLEFIIAVRLAAGKLHLMETLRLALSMIRVATDLSRAAISRSKTGITRVRQATRRVRPTPRPRSSDDPDGVSVGWGAFAPGVKIRCSVIAATPPRRPTRFKAASPSADARTCRRAAGCA